MKEIKNEVSGGEIKVTWHDKHKQSMTFGDRIADSVANNMGSWRFIIIQTIFVICWMVLNVIAFMNHWDPYPFILLNLIFSTQAAYAAPIIMMAQNRQNERDRHQALSDFETNLKAKLEIERLQTEISRMDDEKLEKIIQLISELKK
ncbi:MAG: DUF1003 domain-containing protein [Candidatus Nomurabacteria bacterium]